MKLLFDQQLSPRLVGGLHDLFPDSEHVSSVGLDTALDVAVWEYCRAQGFTLVSKDRDFSDLAVLRGFPPKFIWLQLGNCTTAQVESLLRSHADAILEFGADPNSGVLALA